MHVTRIYQNRIPYVFLDVFDLLTFFPETESHVNYDDRVTSHGRID